LVPGREAVPAGSAAAVMILGGFQAPERRHGRTARCAALLTKNLLLSEFVPWHESPCG
jgi:hypothetical protein